MGRKHGGGGASSSGNSTRNSGSISLTWPMVYIIVLFTIGCVIYGWLPEDKLLAILAFFGIPDFATFNIIFIIAVAMPICLLVAKIKHQKDKKVKEFIQEENRRIQEGKDAAARIEMEKWQRENAHKYKNQVGPYANLNNDNKEDDS